MGRGRNSTPIGTEKPLSTQKIPMNYIEYNAELLLLENQSTSALGHQFASDRSPAKNCFAPVSSRSGQKRLKLVPKLPSAFTSLFGSFVPTVVMGVFTERRSCVDIDNGNASWNWGATEN
jgi:hypothetical protein